MLSKIKEKSDSPTLINRKTNMSIMENGKKDYMYTRLKGNRKINLFCASETKDSISMQLI